ncbi:acyl-CoA dehydrogenase family protein [Pantoea stewartii]|uniref:hypothetical protein n=1 Tax=Pantoea stewartii TaxID=66269 RepID=UPI0021E87B17|nr:hypothetical protein [Pantoea stewartii]UYK98829.1 hypothetical protein NG832_07490 [Pantoea stewartii]
MPDALFNDIYALFKNQLPVQAIQAFRLRLAEEGALNTQFQLAVISSSEQIDGNDPVLQELGLYLASAVAQPNNRVDHYQTLSAVAARLGLLARMLAVSWQHLSSRKSFGVKTTKHQLVKAEFADVSNHIDAMLMQWQLRIAQEDFAGVEEDHWQISVLSNRAEKLMGGHGYLLGNTHSLSYLSMMIYSLYGKSCCNEHLPQVENMEQQV